MTYDPNRSRATFSLTPYVAEWHVEDVERYERLTGIELGVDKPKDRLDPQRVKPAVVTVVLEVPRPMMDQVTTSLRGPLNRPMAQYLSKLAAAADDVAGVEDRSRLMAKHIQRLEQLVRKLAGQNASASVETVIAEARASAEGDVRAWHDALNERKTQVAAELLVAIPDEP